MTTLSPEQTYLLDLARAIAFDRDRPRLPQSGLRHGVLLDEAARQKLLYQVADAAASSRLNDAPAATLYEDLLAANRQRNSAYRAVALEVQEVLARTGAPSLARKGFVYDRTLYGGQGLRSFGDLDFFVSPAHAPAAEAALLEAGFFHGDYDDEGRRLKPFSRREVLRFRLFPDHLPRMARAHNDPFLKAVILDISTDLAWDGSPYADAARRLLEAEFAKSHRDEGVRTLSAVGHFFDGVFHLYREASIQHHIEGGYDVRLNKFQDVVRLWRALSAADAAEVRTRITELDLALPVAWVFHHADAVFGSAILQDLGLAGALAADEPNVWLTNNHERRRWQGGMLDRIFTRDRRVLFEGWSLPAATGARA